jgi:hypothetical protein
MFEKKKMKERRKALKIIINHYLDLKPLDLFVMTMIPVTFYQLFTMDHEACCKPSELTHAL